MTLAVSSADRLPQQLIHPKKWITPKETTCSILSGSTSSATAAHVRLRHEQFERLQYPQRIDFLSNNCFEVVAYAGKRNLAVSSADRLPQQLFFAPGASVEAHHLQYPQRIDFLSNRPWHSHATGASHPCSILSGSTSSATKRRDKDDWHEVCLQYPQRIDFLSNPA